MCVLSLSCVCLCVCRQRRQSLRRTTAWRKSQGWSLKLLLLFVCACMRVFMLHRLPSVFGSFVLLFPWSSSSVSGDTGSPVEQQSSYSSLSAAQLDAGEQQQQHECCEGFGRCVEMSCICWLQVSGSRRRQTPGQQLKCVMSLSPLTHILVGTQPTFNHLHP